MIFFLTCCTTPSATFEFTNSEEIDVSYYGEAWPSYPSTINVTGVTGNVTRLQVKIDGIRADAVGYLSVALVSPSGCAATLMSGGSGTLAGGIIVFDDRAPERLGSKDGTNNSCIYRPANGDWAPPELPGITGPIGSELLPLGIAGINGEWKLFVYNNSHDEAVYIESWSLLVETGTPAPVLLLLDDADGGITNHSQVRFDDALAGGSQDRTLTLKNAGSAAINQVDLMIVGGDSQRFSVVQPPVFPIPPFSNTTFRVQFKTKAAGQKASTMTISGDGLDTTGLNVTMVGNRITRSFHKEWDSSASYTSAKIAVNLEGDVYEADFGQYLRKSDRTTGRFLWETKFFTNVLSSRIHALVVDSYGDAIITTSGPATNGKERIVFTKINSQTGGIVWQRQSDAWDGKLAADPKGNPIFAGFDGTNNGMVVFKLGFSDGEKVWEKRWAGVNILWGLGVTTDHAGDFFVTGAFQNGLSETNDYAAKRSGADGSLVWENASTNGRSFYYTVGSLNFMGTQADSHGNLLTLTSGGSQFRKYAASGGLLFERSFGPREAINSGANNLMLDSADNLYIGGFGVISNSDGSKWSSYVAKYANSTGQLLWEREFSRPILDLGLGSDGQVFVRFFYNYPTNSMAACSAETGDVSLEAPLGRDYTMFNISPLRMVVSRNTAFVPNGFGILAVKAVSGALSVEQQGQTTHVYVPALPGEVYEVQRASSLTGVWTTIGTVAGSSDGIVDFIDEHPPDAPAFYRSGFR